MIYNVNKRYNNSLIVNNFINIIMKLNDLYESKNYNKTMPLNDGNFSQSSFAIQSALAYAKKKGYEVVEDSEYDKISSTKKPSNGKTIKFKLNLTKNGKKVNKLLVINVYNRETDKYPYELNSYIS